MEVFFELKNEFMFIKIIRSIDMMYFSSSKFYEIVSNYDCKCLKSIKSTYCNANKHTKLSS